MFVLPPGAPEPLSPHLVVQYDGARAVKVLPHQHLPHGPVQVAHFDPVRSRICPVHFPADGIHREPVCGLQPCRKSAELTGSCLKTDRLSPQPCRQTGGPKAAARPTCGDEVLLLRAIQTGTADPVQRAVGPVHFSWKRKAWLSPDFHPSPPPKEHTLLTRVLRRLGMSERPTSPRRGNQGEYRNSITA